MKKYRIYVIILVAIVAIAGIGIWMLDVGSSKSDDGSSKTEDRKIPISISQIPTVDLTEAYIDDNYNFTFKHPGGYAVTAFADPQDENASIVLLQNSSTSVGFQIRIAPIDEDISVLTVERIRQDLPDLVINNPQEVILGDGVSAGKGVAFMSDDVAFGGASREVWFIFNRHLYQIRTYAAYDQLVQAVLGSWEFR